MGAPAQGEGGGEHRAHVLDALRQGAVVHDPDVVQQVVGDVAVLLRRVRVVRAAMEAKVHADQQPVGAAVQGAELQRTAQRDLLSDRLAERAHRRGLLAAAPSRAMLHRNFTAPGAGRPAPKTRSPGGPRAQISTRPLRTA